MIKSISYSDQEIISNILKLNDIEKIDLDPCYSVGNFYKSGKISEPTYKFDINPKFDYVLKHDVRNLPLDNNFLNCVIFDPPFLATTGKSLTVNDNSNKINKRFSVFKSEKELFQFYIDSLYEIYRILKEDGILIFKIQDKISSGSQYLSHVFVINEAEKIGFYTKDLYILLAKNRIIANWQKKNQQHCRKFHSYYLVFKKCNKKISYL